MEWTGKIYVRQAILSGRKTKKCNKILNVANRFWKIDEKVTYIYLFQHGSNSL